MAGLFSLGVAVALPHIVFGALLVFLSGVIEFFHAIPARDQVPLVALRPHAQYWRFVFVMFSTAIVLWGFDSVKRVIFPKPTEEEMAKCATEYGTSTPRLSALAW